MNVDNPIRIRDYIILVHLSPCLGYCAGMLEDYKSIDEDNSWIGKSPTPDVISTSPEFAIRQTKHIKDEIWRCELLASMISTSEFKRSILTVLAMCHEAIGQSDVPAEMALFENCDAGATRICSEGICRAWKRCGSELLKCAARCTAEVKILFPNGCKTEDVKNVIPFNFDVTNLNTISTLELSEIATRWNNELLNDGIESQNHGIRCIEKRSFWTRVVEATEFKPGWLGFSIDLKSLFNRRKANK